MAGFYYYIEFGHHVHWIRTPFGQHKVLCGTRSQAMGERDRIRAWHEDLAKYEEGELADYLRKVLKIEKETRPEGQAPVPEFVPLH